MSTMSAMSANKTHPKEAWPAEVLPKKEKTNGVFSKPLFSVEELRSAVRVIVVGTAGLVGSMLAYGGMMFGFWTVLRYLPKDVSGR